MADGYSSYGFPQEIYILEHDNSYMVEGSTAPNYYRMYHDLSSARSMRTRQINNWSYLKESDPERYERYKKSWRIFHVSLGRTEEVE